MRKFIVLLAFFCFAGYAFASTAISENVPQTFTIGRGTVQHMEWQPNGDTLLVSTEIGAWLYDSTLADIAYLSQARLAAFSSDGHTIAGVNTSNNITLWDADTFQLIDTIPTEQSHILDLVWQPDGTVLATLDRDGTLILWDTTTRTALHHINAGSADHLLWSSSGSYLTAYQTTTDSFTVWDTSGQQVLRKDTASAYTYGADFVWRDDTHLVRSTYFGEWTQVIAFDVMTGETRELLQLAASDIAYNPQSGAVAAAHWSAGAFVYRDDTTTTYDFRFGGQTVAVGWSPDGTRLALGSWQRPASDARHVWIVDAENGAVLWDFTDAHADILDFRWHPDSSKVVVIDYASVIYLYDIENGELIASSDEHALVGSAVAWDDASARLAVGDAVDAVRVWDATSGSLLATFDGHDQQVTEVAWRPNSSMLAARGGDYSHSANTSVYLWDWQQGEQPIIAFPHKRNVVDMAWSPDGVWLAVAPNDYRIDLWNMPTGEHRELAIWEPETLMGVEWSTDGSVIAAAHWSSGNGGFVGLWNPANGEQVEGGVGFYASSHVWTPDNHLFGATWGAYGCGGMPQPIYDVSFYMGYGDGIESRTLSGLKDEVANAVISPDGQQVAGFDRSNHMIMWDVSNGSILFEFDGARSASWSPDNRVITVVTIDGQTLLLDAQTFDTLQMFEGEWQILWSPDSLRFAQIGYGVIHILQAFS